MVRKSLNGEWKGTVNARLDSIEAKLGELQSEANDHREYAREQFEKIHERMDKLSTKLTYVYAFAGGIGVTVSIVASWLLDRV